MTCSSVSTAVAKWTSARLPRNVHAFRTPNTSTKPPSPNSAKKRIHTPLSSLPTEIIEHIALFLDLPTFRSLRLTSSHYPGQTLLIFKHRFFTTQHLSWTKHSLQRLVDISTHPDLGDALHHLIIDATPHYSLQLWKMRRRSSDAGHMTPTTDDEDGCKLIHRLHDDFERVSQEAESVAKRFNETRYDINCLKRVLSKVKMLESVTFEYQGMEIRYSKFAARYCETSQHEMSRPFVSTLSALAASGIRVQRIEIAKKKTHGAVSVGRLESLAPSLRFSDHAFEALDTLLLKLRDWRSPDTGFELQSTRAPFVARFLAKCRNVRVLELSCYSALEKDLFGELARACSFERLERYTLDLFGIKRSQDLQEFLGPSSDFLRELRLRHVLLADPESTWAELFVSLAESMPDFTALQILHAERLFTERSSNVVKRVLFHDGTSLTGLLRVEGQHWRDELRHRGCRYVESEAARMWESGAITYPFMRSDST